MKTKSAIRNLLFFLILTIFAIHAVAQKKVKVNKHTFGALKVRHIGPAVMSGRVSAIDAVQADPRLVYVGTASGGVWKSKNAGIIFKAVFDKYTQSIGAVTIDQAHPDTVWVGTGETWVRNSVSVGDGIYKTIDGGETWKKMGLDSTERIGRIVINPENPNIVYVAALGHLWDANRERGVYKTEDGGKSWTKILYVDENTGCSDLAIDKDNPDILYAGMWDFRRRPYFFRSGGPGSGLFKTTDGGKTWEKLENGLPDGTLGRIALAISPADQNIVWALIEAEKSGLYRSKDKGENWELMTDNPTVGERPFYFALIVPDPVDTNRIYKPGFTLNVSDNGGKTFTVPFVGGGNVHSDIHAVWISEKDPDFIYIGTDGGVYVSNDKGNTWRIARNLPVSQFYRVSVDNDEPYNVYGGLQDNGSWMAPSRSPRGIQNANWDNIGYGDGFNVVPDLYDENIIYWQYQGGNIKKMFKDTREIKNIKPFGDEETEKLRFNWNTPLVYSPTSKALYVGSQYLFKSNNNGDTWLRISPDLTTNDPDKLQQEETGGLTIDNSTAENHCTIYAINESPLDTNLIWVGTDDGNLQLTTDGGKNWTNVSGNIPGLPLFSWCSWVEPSGFDKETAYATFDSHRNGDMKSYVFKTTDMGKSWENITDENIESYCYTIREDPVNPNLLFLGTEFGLYISIDGGKAWTRFTGDFPKVSVQDIVFQERENDLVLGTHGRGILILDDISPLRQLNEDVLQEDVAFLESRPYVIKRTGGQQSFSGDDEFVGGNPPGSSIITYYLKKRHIFGDMSIEIFNEEGEKIKTLAAGKRKGINRVPWRMRMKPPKVPSSVQLLGHAFFGPTYPPGEYSVKILKGDNIYEGKIKVVYDPDSKYSVADRDLRCEIMMKAYNLLEELAYINRQITDFTNPAEKILKNDNVKKSTKKELRKTSEELNELRKQMLATRMGRITGEIRLRERISEIYGGVMSYMGSPTDSQIEGIEMLEKEVENNRQKVKKILDDKLPEINKSLKKAGITPIKITTFEEFLKEK